MATALGTLDLTNVLPARMATLGISNIELASRYANVSPTTLRRMLNGAPGFAEKLQQFEKTLTELENLKKNCWPIPIDFSAVGFVKFTQQRIEHGLTTIHNADSQGPVVPDAESGLDALAGSKEEKQNERTEATAA
jgi:hypothetical protein